MSVGPGVALTLRVFLGVTRKRKKNSESETRLGLCFNRASEEPRIPLD